jgi:hypothetical protein
MKKTRHTCVSHDVHKEEFITLSPARIEVTSFNNLGNQILDDEERLSNNGCRCIDDNRSRNVVSQYSLDSEGVVEKGS